MSVRIPPELDAKRSLGDDWADWLDALPRLVDDLLGEWQLEIDGAPRSGHTAIVVPVQDADGAALALKVTFQEPDNAGEIPTLQRWAGRRAVRLERADPHRGTLLLERLDGLLREHRDPLKSARIVADLYRDLHVPGTPRLPDVHRMVHGWLDDLAGLGRRAPAPPRLVEQAIAAGRRLAAEPGTHVLHGDLHDENVMRRGREWVAIDPKGVVGDPCFEPAPLLWNRWDEYDPAGGVAEAIRERFATIVDEAGLDERRTRDWVAVRAIVNVGWQAIDGEAVAGGPAGDAREWITRNITIAKAVLAIEPWPSD